MKGLNFLFAFEAEDIICSCGFVTVYEKEDSRNFWGVPFAF